jgi:hypothetical protein
MDQSCQKEEMAALLYREAKKVIVEKNVEEIWKK